MPKRSSIAVAEWPAATLRPAAGVLRRLLRRPPGQWTSHRAARQTEPASGLRLFPVLLAVGALFLLGVFALAGAAVIALPQLWPVGAAIAGFMLALGGAVGVYLMRHARAYAAERLAQEKRLRAAMLEAREASHAKSLFLANMSHELRTPLNAVIGYSQLLRLNYVGTLGEKQAEYVDSIEGAGRHLLSLLQDILDLSKIEAGREELDEQDAAVQEIVGNAIALMAPRAREKGATIAVEGPEPITLRADSRRLLQMVLNLLSNAVRFAPKGSAITVRWQRRPDGTVAISVADRGPGIDAEDLPRVLEPFHRPAGKAGYEGSESNGLGLPLTGRLMTLHGGRLDLVNAPQGGLVATLLFPPERDLGDASAPQAEVAASVQAAARRIG